MLSKTTTSLITNATIRNYSAGNAALYWTKLDIFHPQETSSSGLRDTRYLPQSGTKPNGPRSSARLAFHRCENGAILVQLQPKHANNPFGFFATRQQWNETERFRSKT